MITIKDIEDIVSDLRGQTFKASKGDIAFCLLRDIVGNEVASYLAFNTPVTNLAKYVNGNKVKLVKKALSTFELNTTKKLADINASHKEESYVITKELTKDENRKALMDELREINYLQKNGELEAKDAIMAKTRIRFELNKNFEMEKSDDERRIIVVPQKHDKVCPYTHRECTDMPTKEACMQYYNLVEKEDGNG